eukprot:scaffold1087_cov136-Cylindrotheca_fusiformis.AAC.8
MAASKNTGKKMPRFLALTLLVVVERIHALHSQCPADHLLNLLSQAAADKQALGVFGVHDALSAKILDQQIHDDNAALFISGFGVSASRLGQPDAGILTLPELKDTVQAIVPQTTMPVIVDGDTGFGGAPNMRRTVRDLARLGAAAVTIEDQCFPKKCTYVAGSSVTVLDRSEAKQRMQLAVQAQTEAYEKDGNKILVVARTDCRMQLGLEEARERCLIFECLGANIVYAENLQSEDEYRSLRNIIDCPTILAQVQTGEKDQKLWTLDDIADMGYDMGLFGISGLQAAVHALETATAEILKSGGVVSSTPLSTLEKVKKIVGFDELDAFEKEAFVEDKAVRIFDDAAKKSLASSLDPPPLQGAEAQELEDPDNKDMVANNETTADARLNDLTVVDDEEENEEPAASPSTTPRMDMEDTEFAGKDFLDESLSKQPELVDDIHLRDMEKRTSMLTEDVADPNYESFATNYGVKKSYSTWPPAPAYGQMSVGYFPSKLTGRPKTALWSSKNGDEESKEGQSDKPSSLRKSPLPKFGAEATNSFPKSPFAKKGSSAFRESKAGDSSPFAKPKGSTSGFKRNASPIEDQGATNFPEIVKSTSLSEPKSETSDDNKGNTAKSPASTAPSFPEFGSNPRTGSKSSFSQAKTSVSAPSVKSPFASKKRQMGSSTGRSEELKDGENSSPFFAKKGVSSFSKSDTKKGTGSASTFAEKSVSSFSQAEPIFSAPEAKSPFGSKQGQKGSSTDSSEVLKDSDGPSPFVKGVSPSAKSETKQDVGPDSFFAKKGVTSFSQAKTSFTAPAAKSPFAAKAGPKESSTESNEVLTDSDSPSPFVKGVSPSAKSETEEGVGPDSPFAKKGAPSFSQAKTSFTAPAAKSPFAAKAGPKESSTENSEVLTDSDSPSPLAKKEASSSTKSEMEQGVGPASLFAKKGLSSFSQAKTSFTAPASKSPFESKQGPKGSSDSSEVLTDSSSPSPLAKKGMSPSKTSEVKQGVGPASPFAKKGVPSFSQAKTSFTAPTAKSPFGSKQGPKGSSDSSEVLTDSSSPSPLAKKGMSPSKTFEVKQGVGPASPFAKKGVPSFSQAKASFTAPAAKSPFGSKQGPKGSSKSSEVLTDSESASPFAKKGESSSATSETKEGVGPASPFGKKGVPSTSGTAPAAKSRFAAKDGLKETSTERNEMLADSDRPSPFAKKGTSSSAKSDTDQGVGPASPFAKNGLSSFSHAKTSFTAPAAESPFVNKQGPKGSSTESSEVLTDSDSPSPFAKKGESPSTSSESKGVGPASPFAKKGVPSFSQAKTSFTAPLAKSPFGSKQGPKGSSESSEVMKDSSSPSPLAKKGRSPSKTETKEGVGPASPFAKEGVPTFGQAKTSFTAGAAKSPFGSEPGPKESSTEINEVLTDSESPSPLAKKGMSPSTTSETKQGVGSASPFAKNGVPSFSQAKTSFSTPAAKSPFGSKQGPKGSSESSEVLMDSDSPSVFAKKGVTPSTKSGTEQGVGSASPFAKNGVSSFSQAKTSFTTPAAKSPFGSKQGPKGSSESSKLLKVSDSPSPFAKKGLSPSTKSETRMGLSPSTKSETEQGVGPASKGVPSFSEAKTSFTAPAAKSLFGSKQGPKGSSTESNEVLSDSDSPSPLAKKGASSSAKSETKEGIGLASPFAKKGVPSFSQAKTSFTAPAGKSPFGIKQGPKGSSTESSEGMADSDSASTLAKKGASSSAKSDTEQSFGPASPFAKKGVPSFSQAKTSFTAPAAKSPFGSKQGPKGLSESSEVLMDSDSPSIFAKKGVSPSTESETKQGVGSASPFAKGVSSFSQAKTSFVAKSPFAATDGPKGSSTESNEVLTERESQSSIARKGVSPSKTSETKQGVGPASPFAKKGLPSFSQTKTSLTAAAAKLSFAAKDGPKGSSTESSEVLTDRVEKDSGSPSTPNGVPGADTSAVAPSLLNHESRAFQGKGRASNPAFVSNSSKKGELPKGEGNAVGPKTSPLSTNKKQPRKGMNLAVPEASGDSFSFTYEKDESTGKYVKGPTVKTKPVSSKSASIRLKTASEHIESSEMSKDTRESSMSAVSQGPVSPAPDSNAIDGQDPRSDPGSNPVVAKKTVDDTRPTLEPAELRKQVDDKTRPPNPIKLDDAVDEKPQQFETASLRGTTTQSSPESPSIKTKSEVGAITTEGVTDKGKSNALDDKQNEFRGVTVDRLSSEDRVVAPRAESKETEDSTTDARPTDSSPELMELEQKTSWFDESKSRSKGAYIAPSETPANASNGDIKKDGDISLELPDESQFLRKGAKAPSSDTPEKKKKEDVPEVDDALLPLQEEESWFAESNSRSKGAYIAPSVYPKKGKKEDLLRDDDSFLPLEEEAAWFSESNFRGRGSSVESSTTAPRKVGERSSRKTEDELLPLQDEAAWFSESNFRKGALSSSSEYPGNVNRPKPKVDDSLLRPLEQEPAWFDESNSRSKGAYIRPPDAQDNKKKEQKSVDDSLLSPIEQGSRWFDESNFRRAIDEVQRTSGMPGKEQPKMKTDEQNEPDTILKPLEQRSQWFDESGYRKATIKGQDAIMKGETSEKMDETKRNEDTILQPLDEEPQWFDESNYRMPAIGGDESTPGQDESKASNDVRDTDQNQFDDSILHPIQQSSKWFDESNFRKPVIGYNDGTGGTRNTEQAQVDDTIFLPLDQPARWFDEANYRSAIIGGKNPATIQENSASSTSGMTESENHDIEGSEEAPAEDSNMKGAKPTSNWHGTYNRIEEQKDDLGDRMNGENF